MLYLILIMIINIVKSNIVFGSLGALWPILENLNRDEWNGEKNRIFIKLSLRQINETIMKENKNTKVNNQKK